MFRITATAMAGSEDPRVFKSESAPVETTMAGPGTEVVLRFIGYPVPRVVRLRPEEVLKIEHAEDGEPWRKYVPELDEPEAFEDEAEDEVLDEDTEEEPE